jgi:hypothetical protein
MSTNDLFSSPTGDDVDAIVVTAVDTTTSGDLPTGTSGDPSADHTGQLRLLDTSDLPLQFRLDKATRERGLAHVAELRRLLARNAAHRAA